VKGAIFATGVGRPSLRVHSFELPSVSFDNAGVGEAITSVNVGLPESVYAECSGELHSAVLQSCIRSPRTVYIYTIYIRYYWHGFHQIYGHTRCIYTVLANPTSCRCWARRPKGRPPPPSM
jgi:hypothetical protein